MNILRVPYTNYVRMQYTRFYTVLLIGAMALNIGKYQLPYLEYNLFKNYIAENLCVKKNEANNDCQGHCLLQKQIDLVNEMDENSANPVEKKLIQFETGDYYTNDPSLLQTLNSLVKIQLSLFGYDARLLKTSLDVDVPPPKRFV